METGRLLWIDWMKFISIFAVIGIHISSSLLTPDSLFSIAWYQGVFASSMFRFGIVLFVMASGYLILRRQQSIYEIPKRIKRILLPFIFWMILYAVIKVIILNELGSAWNFGDLIGFIYQGFLNPTTISIQFWFVYMILGLYIISPILSRWIQNAPIKEIEYFLWFWILISLLQFFNVHTILIDYLRYFTGAIGYFIFGYYLSIKNDSLFRNNKFGALLIIIGTAITFIGTISLSLAIGDQSLFYIKLGDITPGACLQGIGLFIILFNTNFDKVNKFLNQIAVKISKLTYGIYLSNILIIKFLEKIQLINLNSFTLFNLGISICIVIIISTFMLEIMAKIPILKKFA